MYTLYDNMCGKSMYNSYNIPLRYICIPVHQNMRKACPFIGNQTFKPQDSICGFHHTIHGPGPRTSFPSLKNTQMEPLFHNPTSDWTKILYGSRP